MKVLPKDSFEFRVQLLIDKAGSQDKLGSLCGISGVMIGKYAAGKAEPSRDKLVAMARASGVSVDWLATGEGVMSHAEPGDVSEPGGRYADAAELEKEYVLVPRYDVRVSAGGGALVESEQVVDHLAFKTKWIHLMNLNPSNLLLVNTIGDSMHPTIKEGDLLLVDKGQREVKDDAIYVLQNDGSLVAKRLQKLYDGSIQIKSDNKAYDAQLVPSDRVKMLNIIGRVVWGGGRM